LSSSKALNKANVEVLESTFAKEKSASALAASLVLVMGMVLLMLLSLSQIYLFKRFRRRINPPLLLATISAFFICTHLYAELRHSAEHLKSAKQDSYNSVFAILSARSSLSNAHAAQSRGLFDRDHAEEHEKVLVDDLKSVADFSNGSNFETTLKRAEKQIKDGKEGNLPGFKGTLAVEFNNIVFEGEGLAALESLKALRDYCEINEKLRKLESSGQHEAAVAMALGYHPGESQLAFTKLDDSLNRLLTINLISFESAIRSALAELHNLRLMVQVFSLFAVICIYFGFSPRIAEYLPQSR